MVHKRILILGAGGMQVPAVNAAHELGWYVTAVDADPNAVAVPLADSFSPIDLKDTETLLSYARSLQQNDGLDAVFTAGTDFSSSVAFITESLHLPGHSYESACNATVKTRMRSCFDRCGVPSPRYVEAISSHDTARIISELQFPLVVKPVDNMGARGCRMVTNATELAQAIDAAVTYSRCGKVIVESYMDGNEFSVDALVYNGTVHITGFADRHIYYPPYFIEMGHTMPSAIPDSQKKELIDVFEAGVHALGLTWGAAKGDLKYTSVGPMIGEIAARLSGGYMSGWTYPYSSGVSVTKAALLLAAGIVPDNYLMPSMQNVCAERAWISIPGTIASVEGLDDALAVPGVRDVLSRTFAGSSVVFPINNVEKCGNVIAVASSRDEAVFAAEEACRKIFIRLKAGNAETDLFLRQRTGFPPDAYQVDTVAIDEITLLSGVCEQHVPQLPTFLMPYAELTDGNRRSLSAALTFLETYISLHTVPLAGLPLRVFWNALLRGGVQAVVYCADTMAARGNVYEL